MSRYDDYENEYQDRPRPSRRQAREGEQRATAPKRAPAEARRGASTSSRSTSPVKQQKSPAKAPRAAAPRASAARSASSPTRSASSAQKSRSASGGQRTPSASRAASNQRAYYEEGYRPSRPRRKKAKKRRTNPIMVVAYLVIAVLLAYGISFLLKEYVFEFVRVNGNAMAKTMMNGDVTIVGKTDYKDTMPKVGDIVAVRVGNDREVILRRVIATPGQTVEFTGHETLIDSQAIEEAYVELPSYDAYPAKTLPAGKYYVCGDNRTEVSDSRSELVGLVSEQDIVGRVRCVIWPIDHLKAF